MDSPFSLLLLLKFPVFPDLPMLLSHGGMQTGWKGWSRERQQVIEWSTAQLPRKVASRLL